VFLTRRGEASSFNPIFQIRGNSSPKPEKRGGEQCQMGIQLNNRGPWRIFLGGRIHSHQEGHGLAVGGGVMGSSLKETLRESLGGGWASKAQSKATKA